MLQQVLFQSLFLHFKIIGKIRSPQGGKISQKMVAAADKINGLQKPFMPLIRKFRLPDADLFQLRHHIWLQLRHRHFPQVMGIHTDCFGISNKLGIVLLDVENGIGPFDSLQVKGFYQFLRGKKFPGFRIRPAQQHQEIHQRPGQKAMFPIKMNRHQFPVAALGNFCPLGIKSQGHMGKLRNGQP